MSPFLFTCLLFFLLYFQFTLPSLSINFFFNLPALLSTFYSLILSLLIYSQQHLSSTCFPLFETPLIDLSFNFPAFLPFFPTQWQPLLPFFSPPPPQPLSAPYSTHNRNRLFYFNFQPSDPTPLLLLSPSSQAGKDEGSDSNSSSIY